MSNSPVQRLLTLPIDGLRPTQITVGFKDVELKRLTIRSLIVKADRLYNYLNAKRVSVVIGPGKIPYIVDGHALVRALYETRLQAAHCVVLEDYSTVATQDAFWEKMYSRRWVFPFDSDGHGPLPFSAIPLHVKDMTDDPFKSLASAVQRSGGFLPPSQPQDEWEWVQYLRSRVHGDPNANMPGALVDASHAAHMIEAAALPGFIPPGW
ncbi:ParB/Sulfiredoxin [Polychytrium aggregatum]|uniref:ParB/Sulfiredoxin n=1 Tax=Polychytrium aggregatum TaxID=110093 RepID=UPI0022FEC1A5|nr:ParB/Sulfiredoxin [Polychytrium aggregatum]KAI9190627.1 ParB/Sulfiredoxin [Polychytrium aggregatum]